MKYIDLYQETWKWFLRSFMQRILPRSFDFPQKILPNCFLCRWNFSDGRPDSNYDTFSEALLTVFQVELRFVLFLFIFIYLLIASWRCLFSKCLYLDCLLNQIEYLFIAPEQDKQKKIINAVATSIIINDVLVHCHNMNHISLRNTWQLN